MSSAEAALPENMEYKKRKKFYVQKRYILILLGFWGMFNSYATRVNLSVAIVAMVNQTTVSPIKSNGSYESIVECPNLLYKEKQIVENSVLKVNQYDWSQRDQGKILGSVFIGYIISQVPGGILSKRFGAKWVFGSGIMVSSVLCLLTPLAADWGVTVFLIVRVIQGLGEGVTYPAMNSMISNWSPKGERSRISTQIGTGTLIGTVVAMSLSGWLCSTDFFGGWPSVFYVFGSFGCIWFLFWCLLVHECPSKHPNISKEELLYIMQNRQDTVFKESYIPWKDILCSIPMWALVSAHFGHIFGYSILLTELPTYLRSILHFNVKSNGALSALPYIIRAVVAWTGSFLADKLRHSSKMSISLIRKVFNSLALLGPGLCLIGICFVGCRPEIIVALISIGMAFNGFSYAGFNVTHIDMSPDHAGLLYAITNTVAHSCGIWGPMVVGVLTSNGATQANWNKVFYTAAAIYIGCATIFAIFGSAERQNWKTIEQKKSEEIEVPD